MPDLQQQLQTTLGDAYRLENELGGGGMSRVFVAHEAALGRKVVIKVLLPELTAGVSVDRFRREIQLAAQLQHPHIVPLLSAGESNGLPFFIMPFVSGESLRARVMRTGELPIAESLRILRDIVSALAYAHSFGVIHRDIKPDNVLISGGVAVVTDFGVAKAVSVSSESSHDTVLTSLGLALGTPAYMAPEQASGDAHIDHRADIYALGVTAYEMLTGRAPFLGRSTQAVLAAQVLEMPEPVDRLRPVIPPMLAQLVMACLAKRAADRPQSATDVLHALDAIATPSSGTAPTRVVSVAPLGDGRSSRRRAIAVATAAGVALVLGLMLWSRHDRAASVVPAPSVTATQPETVQEASKAPPTPIAPTPAPVPAASVTPSTPRRPGRPADESGRRHAPPPPSADTVAPPAVPDVPLAGEASRISEQPPPVPDTAAPPPIRSAAPAAPAAPAAVAAVAPAPVVAPAPPDPDIEGKRIRGIVAEYGRAIESESVDNLKRVYPGMTAAQQDGWTQFFATVHDVKAQLDVRRADVTGDTGSVQVIGVYTYLNGSTHRAERQQVGFHATLRRGPDGWHLSEIR